MASSSHKIQLELLSWSSSSSGHDKEEEESGPKKTLYSSSKIGGNSNSSTSNHKKIRLDIAPDMTMAELISQVKSYYHDKNTDDKGTVVEMQIKNFNAPNTAVPLTDTKTRLVREMIRKGDTVVCQVHVALMDDEEEDVTAIVGVQSTFPSSTALAMDEGPARRRYNKRKLASVTFDTASRSKDEDAMDVDDDDDDDEIEEMTREQFVRWGNENNAPNNELLQQAAFSSSSPPRRKRPKKSSYNTKPIPPGQEIVELE